MKQLGKIAATLGTLFLLSACGGGGGGDGGGGAETEKISEVEASRFLSRATYGTTEEEIGTLRRLGYEAWLQRQFEAPPTYHLKWAVDHVEGADGTRSLREDPEAWKRHSDTLGYLQRDVWWHAAAFAPDQLRQRVAFALSEIFVISRHHARLSSEPDARMSFYDVLVRHAFGNFEELLRAVTYHPAMGKYLSYLGNAKADPAKGSHPDENYAREVMQLFTIGLYRLNPDGTLRRDAGGDPIPTYTQKDVREMARVFTGLTDRNGFFFASDGGTSHESRTLPMISVEEYHDTGEKRILGHTIPAGGTTRSDIDRALQILFTHPNTGPFISRILIQRLVTDNPSPGYIRRVAAAFADNGAGVRGDMKAVIRAILLDPEALEGTDGIAHFGKFREPLLYVSHLFRAFHAGDALNTLRIYDDGPAYRYRSFHFNGTGMTRQEGPLEALTVFNYFTPDDAPYALKKEGLAAPELTLYGKGGIDDVVMGLVTENGFVYHLFNVTAELRLGEERALVEEGDFSGLVDRLDLLLCGGTLRPGAKESIVRYLEEHRNIEAEKLARYAIGLVLTSPDYALQR
jgi:uncharacterized protein (DUF1800 family)